MLACCSTVWYTVMKIVWQLYLQFVRAFVLLKMHRNYPVRSDFKFHVCKGETVCVLCICLSRITFQLRLSHKMLRNKVISVIRSPSYHKFLICWWELEDCGCFHRSKISSIIALTDLLNRRLLICTRSGKDLLRRVQLYTCTCILHMRAHAYTYTNCSCI